MDCIAPREFYTHPRTPPSRRFAWLCHGLPGKFTEATPSGRKEPIMRRVTFLSALAILSFAVANSADAACCYFSAMNTDILQPAQKVFISWDPAEKVETFTVQPKFEGNALDFGMVIPTPSQPKLHEMPRDFFKHLAIYTIMQKREFPNS